MIAFLDQSPLLDCEGRSVDESGLDLRADLGAEFDCSLKRGEPLRLAGNQTRLEPRQKRECSRERDKIARRRPAGSYSGREPFEIIGLVQCGPKIVAERSVVNEFRDGVLPFENGVQIS